MEGRELRRSYTQVDFPVGRSKADLTGKQQVRTNKKLAMPTTRIKFPTLEIYRPPGQRIMQEVGEGGSPGVEEASSKLNVHAKEFVMNNHQPSALQTSKSVGNILSHHHQHQQQGEPRRSQGIGRGVLISGSQLRQVGAERGLTRQTSPHHLPAANSASVRVPHSAAGDLNDALKSKGQSEGILKSPMRDFGARPKEGTELRRSKSLYVPHSSPGPSSLNPPSVGHIASSTLGPSLSFLTPVFDVHLPQELMQLITKAQRDVSEYSLGEFAQLARSLVQKADEERRHAEKLADACISVIEREPHSTFLEALINFLIYSVEKKMEDPGKLSCHALMAFLSHLYSQIKALGRFVETKFRVSPHPSSQILHLLAQCCICTLRNPTLTQRNEVECLFFVVTTIGRELEQESGRLLDELVDSIRDALYFSKIPDSRIRKTLLQMLELHAASWQINAESLSFYQSSASDSLFSK